MTSPTTVAGILGGSPRTWGPVTLPFALGPIGAKGCTLYTGAEVVVLLAGLGGRATWSILIPAIPALIERTFFTQGLLLGDPASAAGLASSNGGAATVGER